MPSVGSKPPGHSSSTVRAMPPFLKYLSNASILASIFFNTDVLGEANLANSPSSSIDKKGQISPDSNSMLDSKRFAKQNTPMSKTLTGLDVLVNEGFKRLSGLKIGLLAHPAIIDSKLTHLLTRCLEHNLQVKH